ncbi:hypothetical protein [Pedobacter frigoris]|uniref:hypothetical protein n=1 Tax=Pedobacter frigoris TaxID=2571272 RepID=UPI00292DF021|nr:hypothetical protein [Pedobacter frigoris]
MSLLDVVDIFSNLSLIGNKNIAKKKPKVYVVFEILLALSIFWFALELNLIFNLLSPIVFLSLFIAFGLILTIGIIILIYKKNLIEELRWRGFFTILIPIILLTISFASFANRTYEVDKHESLVTIRDPLQGRNISRVLVTLDGEEIRIRVPKSIGGTLQNGDTLSVEKKDGLMGFGIIMVGRYKSSQTLTQ